MRQTAAWIGALAALALVSPAAAEKRQENFFGTIRLEGKKIGQIHYTVGYDEKGQVEELRTTASYSVLGLQLYSFSQHMHERWRAGVLQAMEGVTDDNGEKYDVALTRTPDGYAGVRNGKPVTLPLAAFPASAWHYRITRQHLLFDLTQLRLMHVEVSEREENVKIDHRTIASRRFDFGGDWEATLWFDQHEQIVKFRLPIDSREVIVTLDQD